MTKQQIALLEQVCTDSKRVGYWMAIHDLAKLRAEGVPVDDIHDQLRQMAQIRGLRDFEPNDILKKA